MLSKGDPPGCLCFVFHLDIRGVWRRLDGAAGTDGAAGKGEGAPWGVRFERSGGEAVLSRAMAVSVGAQSPA